MEDTRKAADIKHDDLKEYLIAISLTLFKGYWKGKKGASGCYRFLISWLKLVAFSPYMICYMDK